MRAHHFQLIRPIQLDDVIVSGKLKIVTTILSVIPEPGFTYSIKKAGGLNSAVEIEFSSATCSSTFSFLYKPGQTRIDSGIMSCR